MKTLIALALATLLTVGCSESELRQFTVVGVNPSGMTYRLSDGQIKYIYLYNAPSMQDLVKPGDKVELRLRRFDGRNYFESIKIIEAEQQ